MSRMSLLSPLFCLGILLASSHWGPGDEPTSNAELTKKNRELVQNLVSPNKEPMTRNRSSGSVKFPAGYDVTAQRRIAAARQMLHDNFEESLPFLVEALDDDRYCMTISWAEGQAYYNRSVGAICGNVIASHLEVYRDKIRFSDSQHYHRYNYSPISKEWWQARESHSLPDLQIEAINWAIERRTAEAEVGEHRRNEISELEKLRDGIAKTRTPAKPRRLLRMVTSDH